MTLRAGETAQMAAAGHWQMTEQMNASFADAGQDINGLMNSFQMAAQDGLVCEQEVQELTQRLRQGESLTAEVMHNNSELYNTSSAVYEAETTAIAWGHEYAQHADMESNIARQLRVEIIAYNTHTNRMCEELQSVAT